MSLHVADILHDCPLFARVPPDSFQRLGAMARLCRFEKGEAIFHEGDPCPGVYVVGGGLVRIYKTSPHGKEHVLHMVEPGSTFAEVAAMGAFPCPANAAAVAPSVCVLLPLEPFQKALREDHPLCLGMMTGLTMWIRHLVGLMGDVVLRDASGRVARYLLQQQTGEETLIELPALKRHVASHLNLTSETFSRTVRRLLDTGLIAEADGGRFELVDLEKLQMLASGL